MDPKIERLRVFCFLKVKMKENKIDYTKLNERIVEQAYESQFTLSEQDKRKLIEGKFERARLYSEALQKSPAI